MSQLSAVQPAITIYLARHATPNRTTGIRYDVAPGPPILPEGEEEAEIARSDLQRAGATREEILTAFIAETDHAGTPDRLFPNVDGVKFLLHGLGCGGTKDDAVTLCGLLAGYISHPNVAGATILSLGCQHAQVALLQEELARRAPGFDKPLLIFEQQKWPSEERMLEAALRETMVGIAAANRCERRPAPLSKLVLGVECGGSDGFSGISANPVIGRVSDLLRDLAR